MTHDAKDKLQFERLLIVCTNTLDLVRQQPNRVEVENIVMNSIRQHEKDCDARLRLPVVAEGQAKNAGILKALTRPGKQRDSRAIRWAKILIPALVTLFGGGALANHFLGLIP